MNSIFNTAIQVLLFSVTIVCLSCSGVREDHTKNVLDVEISSFQEMRKHFEDPPAEYRPAPFWVWNDRITEEQIDRQLQQFKEQGMGGVFIHPRMGLITPYLSDRWNELTLYTVRRGRELGLKVYLYDENAFPSGFAGGHVPAEMPESVEQGHGLELIRSDTLSENAAEQYHLILKKTEEEFTDITGQEDEMEKDDGPFYLFKKVWYEQDDPWHGGFSYVDLLMPGVTEKFIEITMQGYEQNFREEFGRTVPAIFSDEANVEYPDVDHSIRWTPDLFDAFRERWGYDLETKLPLLFEESGNWQEVRHNYYTLLGELFVERWAEPYSRYAEEKNLMWTGHHFEHDWPKPKNGGDWAALAARQHMPGIDILFNRYTEKLEGVNTQFGNARGVKELSSVVNQMGRNRALSETYGGAGWNLTFRDMKRIGDWQYVLGVNFLNPHLSYVSIKGARKRDYPPSFSYHAPWWELYGVLGDYYGRLSLALSSGEHINRTLVIMPTSSAWMYFAPDGIRSHPGFQEVGDRFQKFVSDLEAFQVEYDLGSEAVIREHGFVRGGEFVVGERSYDLIVFPPGLRNIDRHTLELVEQYLNDEGNILSFDALPEYVDGAPSGRVKQILESTDSGQWTITDKFSSQFIDEHLNSENFRISRPDTSSGKLFHRRMQLEDGELLFLVNTGTQKKAKGTVKMKGRSVQQLDPFTGDIQSYPSDISGEYVRYSFEIHPVGSLLFYISDQPDESEAVENEAAGQDIITPDKPSEIRRNNSNVLVLDYADLSLDGQTEEDMYYSRAADKIFRHHGFNEGNPWYMSVQYKTEILDRNNFGSESGFIAEFNFRINGLDSSAVESLQAVVEQPGLWEVSVNGNTVTPLPDEWWLDRAFGVFDISDYVRQGNNKLALKASPMTVFSELERVYIRGEFLLEPTGGGWDIVPDREIGTWAWNRQGMPFYPGRVSYTRSYSLSKEEDSRFSVHLNEWEGTVAKVTVNGKEAGIIGWPPYELDITETVRSGDNEITIEVYGSLKNLLGPHHDDPRRWRVSPGEFGNAPEHQPPGDSYDVIGYGLLKDWDLLKSYIKRRDEE